MLIGYARVSTELQSLAMQSSVSEGCHAVYFDYASGRNTQRPGLQAALGALSSGDTLVVWKLDRLGRSVKDLIEMMADFQARGIHFKSVTESIDTSTAMGRLFFHIMAAMSQMERELTVERTKAGLQARRDAGVQLGRPVTWGAEARGTVLALRAQGASEKHILEQTGVSRATLYRIIRKG